MAVTALSCMRHLAAPKCKLAVLQSTIIQILRSSVGIGGLTKVSEKMKDERDSRHRGPNVILVLYVDHDLSK